MQMHPYLSFNGDCEAAFKFYERCLGATIVSLHRYGGSPMAESAPADWADKVMHGSVRIGNQELLGADVTSDPFERPKGFSLSLQMTNPADAERIFQDLASGGQVVMPLEETFWAARFGMLVDRFGTPWLINCEAAEQPA